MPASASTAATLTLPGNPAAAPRALPEKTSLGAFSPSTEMLFAPGTKRAREGARRLARDQAHGVNAAFGRGGDRVEHQQRSARHDDLPSPFLSEFDQIGTRRHVCRLRAPSLVFPPPTSAGKFVRALLRGVHSIARSACAGNASGSTKAHAIRSLASQACALTWSRAAAQASVNPGTPAKSLRARTRPMAPRPATATRVVEFTGFGTRTPPRSLLLRGPLSEPRVKRRLDHHPGKGQL